MLYTKHEMLDRLNYLDKITTKSESDIAEIESINYQLAMVENGELQDKIKRNIINNGTKDDLEKHCLMDHYDKNTHSLDN